MDYWAKSTAYVKFARSIGCEVRRIHKGIVKVTPLDPRQTAALEDKRNQLEMESPI